MTAEEKITEGQVGGVKFFTSYYGNLEKMNLKTTLTVSISSGSILEELKKVYGPVEGEKYFYLLDILLGYKLGPSWEIYSTYKNSTKPKREKEYEYYGSFINNVWGKVNLRKLILNISEIAFRQGKNKVVFLCYEEPHEFCHRFIVAEILNESVLQQKIKELFVGDEAQTFFGGRLKLS